MKRTGPGRGNEMLVDLVLLADKGYGDIPPLFTPLHEYIRSIPSSLLQQEVSKCRVLVGHTIKLMKTYQAVGSLWRHPRWFQPVVVQLCTFLVLRHIALFDDITSLQF